VKNSVFLSKMLAMSAYRAYVPGSTLNFHEFRPLFFLTKFISCLKVCEECYWPSQARSGKGRRQSKGGCLICREKKEKKRRCSGCSIGIAVQGRVESQGKEGRVPGRRHKEDRLLRGPSWELGRHAAWYDYYL